MTIADTGSLRGDTVAMMKIANRARLKLVTVMTVHDDVRIDRRDGGETIVAPAVPGPAPRFHDSPGVHFIPHGSRHHR